MTDAAEMELKRALITLQAKTVEVNRKIQMIESQIEIQKRLSHLVDLTKEEISTLPAETRTYESIGRMFLLTELPQVMSNLNTRKEKHASRTTTLENNKKFLEKAKGEFMKELVQRRKEMVEAPE